MTRFDTIYSLEDQIAQLSQDLRRARQDAAQDVVDNYAFDGWDGELSLSDLFQGKSNLIVIHNMGGGCEYCGMWADGIAPLVPHLEQVAAIALINHDPIKKQKETADLRNWPFLMADASKTSFTADLGFVDPPEEGGGLRPGTSTFQRRPDGTIQRNDFAFFGPYDKFCTTYSFLELLPESVAQEFEPKAFPVQVGSGFAASRPMART